MHLASPGPFSFRAPNGPSAPPLVPGLALVILGDGFRKVAMITAASNFNHIVAVEKKDSHQLVTSGVYR